MSHQKREFVGERAIAGCLSWWHWTSQYILDSFKIDDSLNIFPSCKSLIISTQLVPWLPQTGVALWVLNYMYMYTNMKGAFVHVWGEIGLLRVHVRTWSYYVHTWNILRVKRYVHTWSYYMQCTRGNILRAHVKSFHIFFYHVPLVAPKTSDAVSVTNIPHIKGFVHTKRE